MQKWSSSMAKKKTKSKWSLEVGLKIYDHIKSGMSDARIASAIGISHPTYTAWKTKKPLVRQAVKSVKAFHKNQFSFSDFVIGRLSDEARDVWDRINRCDKLKNGTERLEVILSKHGVRMRQQLFFESWLSGLFSISKALRKVNIGRGTFELWKKDPEFIVLFEDMQEIRKDFFDEHLCMLVASGDSTATVFGNKTINRDRYPDKSVVDVNIKGTITHNLVDISKFPLKLQKEILTEIRVIAKAEAETEENGQL